ncbi:hypothetical protein ASF00_07515 [Sphingomonas sp. Leaf34]|uniref:glycosyltransferase family 9 protein n=1 Tax=Sphingomonas sp. Leaf34 TaxID=1736216 RepID=UPI0006F2B246|nr:glycosyltransferase family 9 protein [Sphingomonas sp. Leaf34]KQN30560.1 hypothetical protein ASF00_07515 [Sphingomonas sp. Leaf34]
MTSIITFWSHDPLNVGERRRWRGVAGDRLQIVTGGSDQLIRSVFARTPEAICAIAKEPGDILSIASLNVPIVWELPDGGDALAERMADNAQVRRQVAQALARVDAVAGARQAFRDRVEVDLMVGVPAVSLAEALTLAQDSVAVVIGSGLGNMMNATPMIRWIAERSGRRVSVIVNGGPPVGVSLFNGAPWVNFVFPGYEYALGRHYDVLITTSLAGHSEPFCTANTWIQQNKRYDYNLDGRFIREADVYFLGLEEAFGPTPALDAPLPISFLRDVNLRPDGPRVIGVANGIKQGAWAKRQWPHMASLVERLTAQGWTVRCFGLPEEHVPQAEDWTGLSIRETIEGIGRCSYFIGHDGGMVHIAETLGIPTLWLFGPTAIRKNGPFYSQSAILSQFVPCGPCNFKIDWVRCDEPFCMSDISVEDALVAFAKMRKNAEALGPMPVWRPVQVDEMRYEVEAVDRPSRDVFKPMLDAERLIALPTSEPTFLTVIAELLRSGDLAGARSAAQAAALRMPDSVALRHLVHAIEIVADDAPGRGRVDRDATALDATALIAAILNARLTPGQTRALVEIELQACLRVGRNDAALSLLEQFAGKASGTLANWGARQWIRGALALAPVQARANEGRFRQLAAGNKGLTHRLDHAFDEDDVLERWSVFLGGETIVTTATPLAFGRDSLLSGARSFSPPIVLNLGGRQISLAPWTTVLIAAPFCDPMMKQPGTVPNALIRLARQIAAMDLCPIIVTNIQSSERAYFEFRDNVTLVHGSPLWGNDVWSRIIGDVRPGLILSIANMAENMGIRSSIDSPLIPITLHGLHDITGLAALFSTELGFFAQSEVTMSGEDVEVLSQILPQGTGSKPLVPGGRGVLAILNDFSQMGSLLHVIRRNPDQQFTVIADGVSRGPEANMRFVLRSARVDFQAEIDRASIFLQFGMAGASLCAEAHEALSQGLYVVAASSVVSDRVVAPPHPDQEESWIASLRIAARRCSGRVSSR